MKKTLALILVLSLVLLAGVGSAVAGSHKKATGEVYWTNKAGTYTGIYTVFSVHDDAPGANPDRGNLYQVVPGAGSITVEVICVEIIGNEAFFGGEVVAATGDYAPRLGQGHYAWVKDIATPGSGGDMIGGWHQATVAAACAKIGTPLGGTVDDGNLKVHNR